MHRALLTVILIVTVYVSTARAELIDRVLAFVDNDAIVLSEFMKRYDETKARIPSVTKEEVLNTMINRILLKRAATAMRIVGTDEDRIIAEYIDLKVRSYVLVKEEDIEGFYNRHKHEFAGADLADVRADIEKLLIEEDVNARLNTLLSDLKRQAYVKIQTE